MQLMLEDSGAFSNHCSNNDDNTSNNATKESTSQCPEQTSMLLNVQFTAMLISMIFTPLMGAAIDKYGAAPLITVAFTTGGLGLTLLIISTSFHTNNNSNIDGLLFPSFICFGFMSCLTGLYTVQTGLLYNEGRDRNRVISVLNALLDSGAVTYLLLWYIEENTRLTLSVISMIYFGFYVLVMGTAVICWNMIGKNNMKEFMLKRQLSLVQMDEVQHDARGKDDDDGDDNNDDKCKIGMIEHVEWCHSYYISSNCNAREMFEKISKYSLCHQLILACAKKKSKQGWTNVQIIIWCTSKSLQYFPQAILRERFRSAKIK